MGRCAVGCVRWRGSLDAMYTSEPVHRVSNGPSSAHDHSKCRPWDPSCTDAITNETELVAGWSDRRIDTMLEQFGNVAHNGTVAEPSMTEVEKRSIERFKCRINETKLLDDSRTNKRAPPAETPGGRFDLTLRIGREHPLRKHAIEGFRSARRALMQTRVPDV